MKVVKFQNGKYGVRKFGYLILPIWSYKDFSPSGGVLWWPSGDSYFYRGDCFTDLETATAYASRKKFKVIEVIPRSKTTKPKENMKKYLAVALLSAFVFNAGAVSAIFRERFGPNTSNPSWVSCFMNMTPVYQNAGPVTFPNPGNTVLTVSVDGASTCPNTDYDPVGYEWEEYSVDGGITWTIMTNTWTVIFMPHATTTASQIVTCNGGFFDEGPMTEQVSCPKGG